MCKFLKIFIISISLLIGCVVNSYSQTVSSTVEFVLNTNDFIENKKYDNFINNLVPYINTNADRIDNILLIGSASPEGNDEYNVYLASIRADKIYSYIKDCIPQNKIVINNNEGLFLEKTGFDKREFKKLRAVYIEVNIKEEPEIHQQIDTVYVEKIIEKKDTVYVSYENKDKLIFSVYNSLSEDLILRPNIGAEFYFHKMSWFIDGSFSRGTFYGKNYNIDFWHTGLRKYFNDRYDKLYIEVYGRTGWYDTDLFAKDDNGVFGIFFGGGLGIGYKFSVCKHWKITPSIRFGFDNFKFNNYYTDDVGIDVSFGKYTNGRHLINEEGQTVNKNGDTVYWNDKTINKEFFDNYYNLYLFGPTYIGVTIQRDFYIHNKIKKVK